MTYNIYYNTSIITPMVLKIYKIILSKLRSHSCALCPHHAHSSTPPPMLTLAPNLLGPSQQPSVPKSTSDTRQKGCINYYCYYYSSTGDAKYIDSYIVHCCLILRVLSSKKWHSFINFMTLRIKDMRLSSIVLLIAHQNRILTKQLVSICTNYYISGLGAFNRPLPVQVMLVPFCASFTYSVRSRGILL